MKTRFPLLAKILLWLFLNVLVLVGVALVLLRGHFGSGLHWLMEGETGLRVQAAAEVIRNDLEARPERQWTAALEGFSRAYQHTFMVYSVDGRQIAGPATVLPEEVMRLVNERLPGDPRSVALPGGGFGRPPGGPPPRPGPSPQDEEEAGPPPGGRGGPTPGVDVKRYHRELVRAGSPQRYWLVMRVPLDAPGGMRGPKALVMVTDSLRGGLFLDVMPWVWAGVGVLVFSVLFWLPLITGVTRAISQLTRATEKIAEGNFDVQVDERRSDELGRLGEAINRMAARLGGFVTGQKRFLGDIAHELCSPLARMEMGLGVLSQRAPEELQPRVADVGDEVREMSELVSELLSFSKAGLQARQAVLEVVALAPLARRVVEREAAGGSVTVEIDEAVRVLAAPDLLTRAVANVVRNAVRHAGTFGPVVISAAPSGEGIALRIADSGPGVPEDALPRLFDPFFRLDDSRAKETGGVGLGLAIVKACVDACHGTVTARNRTPRGLEVEMWLERA